MERVAVATAEPPTAREAHESVAADDECVPVLAAEAAYPASAVAEQLLAKRRHMNENR